MGWGSLIKGPAQLKAKVVKNFSSGIDAKLMFQYGEEGNSWGTVLIFINFIKYSYFNTPPSSERYRKLILIVSAPQPKPTHNKLMHF